DRRIKMDIFWLFFMFSALQPVIKQKLLEASRKRLIALIERDRKSRVVLLVHRQETMSLLGFPLFRYIDINDSEDVIRAVHLTDPEMPLDLVLHTPGGLVLAATQIARAVFKHKGKVTVFVPHYAMSGGTLIALAADEIIMCEHAVLGPVDPQLGQYPAASIIKVAPDCFPTRRYPFVQTVFQQHAGRKLAMQKSEDSNGPGGFGFRALDFFRHLAFVIRISSPGLPKSLASSCGAR